MRKIEALGRGKEETGASSEKGDAVPLLPLACCCALRAAAGDGDTPPPSFPSFPFPRQARKSYSRTHLHRRGECLGWDRAGGDWPASGSHTA